MGSTISNEHAYKLKVLQKPNDEAMLCIEMSSKTYHTNWWWWGNGVEDERGTSGKRNQNNSKLPSFQTRHVLELTRP